MQLRNAWANGNNVLPKRRVELMVLQSQKHPMRLRIYKTTRRATATTTKNADRLIEIFDGDHYGLKRHDPQRRGHRLGELQCCDDRSEQPDFGARAVSVSR